MLLFKIERIKVCYFRVLERYILLFYITIATWRMPKKFSDVSYLWSINIFWIKFFPLFAVISRSFWVFLLIDVSHLKITKGDISTNKKVSRLISPFCATWGFQIMKISIQLCRGRIINGSQLIDLLSRQIYFNKLP